MEICDRVNTDLSLSLSLFLSLSLSLNCDEAKSQQILKSDWSGRAQKVKSKHSGAVGREAASDTSGLQFITIKFSRF